MLLTLANIAFFLIALAMIVLILLQRGSGASAGSGFGAGASATVFGARGSANFLSRSTAVLAALFFLLALGMAMYASRSADVAPADDDLGIMGSTVVAPSEVPVVPESTEVPMQSTAPAAVEGEVPAAESDVPAASTESPAPAAPAVEEDEVEPPSE